MQKTKILSIILALILILLQVLPISTYAVSKVSFTITPDKTEAHPGDTITYTVKMGAVENLGGLIFTLEIPDGLTYVTGSGKATDGLQTTLKAAKAEFTESTLTFVVGSSNYTSTGETTLMTFQCSVNEGTAGTKSITFEDDAMIVDTTVSSGGEDIPADWNNPNSAVTITIPATGITLDTESLTLVSGNEATLTATVAPNNATDTVSWTVADNEIATVTGSGTTATVTAKKAGSTTITATAGTQVANCVLKVTCAHSNKTKVEAKDATCTETGNNEYYVCDVCGQAFKSDQTTETTVKDETISALGHDFTVAKYDENNHWNECSRCGVKDTEIAHSAANEQYESDKTNHWRVCGCGVIVDKGAHEAGETVKENSTPSTCITKGQHEDVVYCSVCNKELSRTSVEDELAAHTAGEAVKENIVESTVDSEGSYDEVVYCSVCETELSRTSKTTPKFVYEITEGANGIHELSTSSTLTLKSNGKVSKFVGVKVDGEEISAENYTSDSDGVELKADYLNTLTVGEHEITLVYDDGSVSSVFNITKKAAVEENKESATTVGASSPTTNESTSSSSSPYTGDESNLTMWIYGLMVSGICFIIAIKWMKKDQRTKGKHF